ncbi:MAG: hypothetical protein ACREQY_21780 [Candidatus Binatia bacterium]
MAEERSDQDILARLIERARLLIAISEEIPVDTKLQTQPLLKMLEAEVLRPEEEHDQARVRSTYSLLRRDLDGYPDLEALLGAMENFISYL